MHAAFWGDSGYVESLSASSGVVAPRAAAWPVSQALAASIAMASITRSSAVYQADIAAGVTQLDAYWSPGSLGSPGGYASVALPAVGHGGDQYYDDNEWIGLDLLAAYRRWPDPTLLTRARSIFNLVASGWPSDSPVCSGAAYCDPRSAGSPPFLGLSSSLTWRFAAGWGRAGSIEAPWRAAPIAGGGETAVGAQGCSRPAARRGGFPARRGCRRSPRCSPTE